VTQIIQLKNSRGRTVAKLGAALLIVVGLINLYPVIGVISSDQLAELYGVSFESVDHLILMRHRAVLFGLLGTFIIYSVFKRPLRPIACVAGLVSMLSFALLAFLSADYGDALRKVVVVDVIGSAALAVVLVIEHRAPDREICNKLP